MKKGSKYKEKYHKFLAILSAGFITSTIAFSVLVLISLGGILDSVFSFCTQTADNTKEIVSIVISTLSFLISLLGTVKSINDLRHSYFHRQLLQSNEYKSEIISKATTGITADYSDNAYKWGEYDGEYFLYSDIVNDALYKRSNDMLLNVHPRKRKIGKDRSEVLYRIVENKISQGKSIFNSDLVRLRTDMFVKTVLAEQNNLSEVINRLSDPKYSGDSSELKVLKLFKDIKLVEVEKTDYFTNITTNDQMYNRYFSYDGSSIFCGKDMNVDSSGLLFDLSQSPAANIIGVNTLAVTSDGYLVINVQNRNDYNNNTFVPSGSGSSDFSDLMGCRKSKKTKREEVTSATSVNDRSKQSQLKDIIEIYDDHTKGLKLKKKKLIKCMDKSGKFNNKNASLLSMQEDYDNRVKEYFQLMQEEKDKNIIKKYIKKMRKYTCDFKKFITYGMVRELVEESYICDPTSETDTAQTIAKYMDSTHICGFIRLLDRGGKPDFFGITFLDLTKHEIKDMHKKYKNKITNDELKKKCVITDFNEICSQAFISMEDFDSCENIDEFKDLLNKDNDNNTKMKVSLQLYCLFELLKDNKELVDMIHARADIINSSKIR